MKRVIIESPYSSGLKPDVHEVVERNLRYLRACLRDSLLRGEAPYASHGLYTQPGVFKDDVPEERKRGMEAGFAYVDIADISAVYADLGITPGMLAGIERARSRGILVDRLDVDLESPGPGHEYHCPLWRKPSNV